MISDAYLRISWGEGWEEGSNPKVVTCKNLYKYEILINIAILIMIYKDYILYLIY